MSDPINQLMGDHSQVKRLFNQWSHLAGAAPGMESAVAITGLLKIHTILEEELVYPVLSRLDESLAAEAEAEHAKAKDIIDTIEAMPADWSAPVDNTGEQHAKMVDAMLRLEKAVMHHVEEEESVIFPKLTAECPAAELEAMGHAMYARRQQLLTDDGQGVTETLIGASGSDGSPKI